MGHDRAEPGCLPGKRVGDQCRAGAGEHERQDRLALRRHHDDQRREAHRREGLVEEPAARRPLRGGDKGHALKILDGKAVRGADGAGRQHHRQTLDSEVVGRQRVRQKAPFEERKLALTVLQQGHQIGGVIGGGEVDDHTRMCGTEPADETGQRVGCQSRQRAQGKRATLETRDGSDFRPGGLDVAQHLTSRAHECGAGGSQTDSSPEPLEQLDAKLVFELFDGQRERGLGHEYGF